MGKRPSVVPDVCLEPIGPEDEALVLVEEMGMTWGEAESRLSRTRRRVREELPSLFDDPEALSDDC